jgi:cysteinyl-tRNA synthetase
MQREGRDFLDIATEFSERFMREMDALNIQRAHHYPRASEVIPKIIEIIQGLIAGGHAYVVDGDVYYRVGTFATYGRLSGRSLDQMQAGARIEVDERKEHPMDFALWKASKPGEPMWPSPWGMGRPGWHIECSAMSMQFLGPQIDLHGGGDDLRFPHHENEIAQSEAFTGRPPFARFWVHNALMKPPVGEEMHRHLGNFVSIQDALARYDPDAIRLFILSAHYRVPLRWTDEAVTAAGRGAERLRTALTNAETALERTSGLAADGPLARRADETRAAFDREMDDDFGTPGAVAALFDLAAEINRAAGAALQGDTAGAAGLAGAAETLRRLTAVLGFRMAQGEVPAATAEALAGLLADLRAAEPALFDGGTTPTDAASTVGVLLAGREMARRQKRFPVADEVRRRLAGLGIVVEDLPGGARWRVASRRDAKS